MTRGESHKTMVQRSGRLDRFFLTLSPCLLVCLSLPTGGCDLPGRPKPADQYVPPQKEMTFSVLFQQNCAGCHGADGKLGPAPPLNDKLFLALVPDAELQRVVSEGRPGTLMPAFAAAKGGELTAEQVRVLTEGIKSNPRWGPVEPAPTGAPPYLLAATTSDAISLDAGVPEAIRVPPRPVAKTDPDATPAAAGVPEVIRVPPRPHAQTKPDSAGAGNKGEGVKVFARACACCHGDRGQGGQYGGKADGKSVGAINDPDFLALISDQALRRFVITGRPDLGMPDYADPKGRPEGFKPLTCQEVTDVVALLAYWRQGDSVNGKEN